MLQRRQLMANRRGWPMIDCSYSPAGGLGRFERSRSRQTPPFFWSSGQPWSTPPHALCMGRGTPKPVFGTLGLRASMFAARDDADTPEIHLQRERWVLGLHHAWKGMRHRPLALELALASRDQCRTHSILKSDSVSSISVQDRLYRQPLFLFP